MVAPTKLLFFAVVVVVYDAIIGVASSEAATNSHDGSSSSGSKSLRGDGGGARSTGSRFLQILPEELRLFLRNNAEAEKKEQDADHDDETAMTLQTESPSGNLTDFASSTFIDEALDALSTAPVGSDERSINIYIKAEIGDPSTGSTITTTTSPTIVPTDAPSSDDTRVPSPTESPTISPTPEEGTLTNEPTMVSPTDAPTENPSYSPTTSSTDGPTDGSTTDPTATGADEDDDDDNDDGYAILKFYIPNQDGLEVTMRFETNVIATYDQPLAHEGTIVLDDGVLFTSNRLTDDDTEQQSVIVSFYNFTSKETIDLGLSDSIPMANGAEKLDNGLVAILSQGTMTEPSGIYTYNITDGTVAVLTTTWGYESDDRQYNSPNDIVEGPGGTLWFTDPIYGYCQGFRPKPYSGNWVGMYDPKTTYSRVVADNFVRPNGIAFSRNDEYAYITDSGKYSGFSGGFNGDDIDTSICQEEPNLQFPATIFRYRLLYDAENYDPPQPVMLTERTVFAVLSDPDGVPDGIQIDRFNNVWAGTGIGIEIFNSFGNPVGFLPVEGGVADFRLVQTNNDEITVWAMAETRLIQIIGTIQSVSLVNSNKYSEDNNSSD